MSLINKCFHIFDENKPQYQGRIISKEDNGYYLVVFYEWLLGEESEKNEIISYI